MPHALESNRARMLNHGGITEVKWSQSPGDRIYCGFVACFLLKVQKPKS